jgi:V8-like Glu-specific endopeptidase
MRYFILLSVLLAGFSAQSKTTLPEDWLLDVPDNPIISICGDDEREPSQVRPIARMMKTATSAAGCTGTLVGKSCMVSAGHCIHHLKVAQFNVPESKDSGSVNYPEYADQYRVAKVYDYRDDGIGNDWAVYRLEPNNVTGLKAGDVQGFYEHTLEIPRRGAILQITGYGSDRSEPRRNYAQQSNVGVLKDIRTSGGIDHQVDTMPGNSGSAIMLRSSQKIIGIHSHGGCGGSGANRGTALVYNGSFRRALNNCLAED